MEHFNQIIQKYYPVFYKIGRSYTNNENDFKDLYQEMLIQVYQSLKSFREESSLMTWIYRVAINTALTYSKQLKKRARELNLEDVNQVDYTEEDYEEAKTEIEMLYEAIRELNKVDRAIVLLHLEGKKYEEIAEILGISKSNTGVKLSRIKQKLQKSLYKKGYARS